MGFFAPTDAFRSPLSVMWLLGVFFLSLFALLREPAYFSISVACFLLADAASMGNFPWKWCLAGLSFAAPLAFLSWFWSFCGFVLAAVIAACIAKIYFSRPGYEPEWLAYIPSLPAEEEEDCERSFQNPDSAKTAGEI